MQLHCHFCQKTIIGRYFTDMWGHSIHEGHHVQFCNCCHSFIDQQTSMLLKDGRKLCQTCFKYGVSHSQSAHKGLSDVNNLFQKAGLQLPMEKIQLHLCDKDELNKFSTNHYEFQGITLTKTVTGLFWEKQDYTIYTLTGLHEVAFRGILAHELMHVYIAKNHIILDKRSEEGLCELIHYFILQASRTEIGKVLMKNINNNPDPIYGDGFRIMQDRLQQKGGWQKLLQSISKAGNFR